MGLFHLYHGRSSMASAKELAQDLLSLATRQADPSFFVGAHYALGVNALFRGKLAEAQSYLDRVGADYDSEQHKPLVLMYGFNPVVICRLFGAIARVLRGYPDQGRQLIEHTLSLDHEMTSAFTNVYAHCVAPLGYQCLRDPQATAMQADAGVALGTHKDFAVWIAFGTVLGGWGRFTQGRIAEGISEMQDGLVAMHEIGAKSQLPHYLTMLAEAIGGTGDSVQALQHAEDALAAAEQGGEHFYEPETWRAKGELLLQSGAKDAEPEAIACFVKALELVDRLNN